MGGGYFAPAVGAELGWGGGAAAGRGPLWGLPLPSGSCGSALGQAAVLSRLGREGQREGGMLPGGGKERRWPSRLLQRSRRGGVVQKIWAIWAGFTLSAPGVDEKQTGLHSPGTVAGAGLSAHIWVVPKLGTAVSTTWEVILG